MIFESCVALLLFLLLQIYSRNVYDTTRDEIIFYDLNFLSAKQKQFHEENVSIFKRALSQNAKERARRFDLISSEKNSINKTHQAVK